MTFHSSVQFHNYPSTPGTSSQPYLPDTSRSLAVFADHGPRLTISFKAVWPNGRANIPGCDQTRAEIMIPAILNSLGDERYAFLGARNPRTKVFRDGILGTEEGLLSADQAEGLMSFVERFTAPCARLGLTVDPDKEIKVDASALRAIVEAEAMRFLDTREREMFPPSPSQSLSTDSLASTTEKIVSFPVVNRRLLVGSVSR